MNKAFKANTTDGKHFDAKQIKFTTDFDKH